MPAIAPHARKQIRDKVWQLLQNLATTADNVFLERGQPLSNGGSGGLSELPGIVIEIRDEAVVVGTKDTVVKQDRLAELTVLAYAEDETVEDTLDQIAAEIEIALLADTHLGGLAENIALTGAHKEIGDGNKPNGELRLSFLIRYRTAEGVPTAVIPPG